MAYIRYGTLLPSGERSREFVIGDPGGLVSLRVMRLVPYSTVREWLKEKTEEQFKETLGNALELGAEELGQVCQRIFEEKKQGGWEKPFEFEKNV